MISSNPQLSQIISTTEDILQLFSLKQGLHPEYLSLVFGKNSDRSLLQLLETQFSLGDFSSLPTVEIKSISELSGAMGVYASDLDKIFISEEFLHSASESEIVAVLLEEIGHSLDNKINLTDTKGDEGYLFSALVRGINLTTSQLLSAQQEDDQIEISIDGQKLKAEAATLVVNTNNDLVDAGDGVTSLREALNIANSGDIITFASSLSGQTITLNGSELVVNKSLTIDGDIDNDGIADITVSGNNTSRVLNIDNLNNNITTVRIDGLTIAQGLVDSQGGGIRNQENLTIVNSNLIDNSAYYTGGGIDNRQTLTITGSTITANSANNAGGGIYSRGNITITDSVVTGNVTEYGGGVYSRGVATITRSTIANNSANYNGGGVYTDGMATISNSTIANNSANYGGGIYNFYGTMSVIRSTLTANVASYGGGIYNIGGTTILSNSIISGNTATGAINEVLNSDGTIIANSNNLFGDLSQTNTQAFNNFTAGVTDITATIDGNIPTPLNNILDPLGLRDNGGKTPTIALTTNSPALDAGNNNNNPNFDQRGTGFDRIINNQIDIGAFELQNRLFVGSDNDDNLTGDKGNDTLIGGRGNDTLNGRLGNDSLVGGVGNDLYFVNNINDIIKESLDQGIDTVNSSSPNYNLSVNIENLNLIGINNLNAQGNDSNNLITGNDGNNVIQGNNGNDTLNGGKGSDTLEGNNGNDYYFVDHTQDKLNEQQSQGIDTVSSSIAYQLRENFEDLILTGVIQRGNGNSLDNTIVGNQSGNRLNGKNGNDTIIGGGGNDTIIGGNGIDSLIGGIGDDFYLIGRDVSDQIFENTNQGFDLVRTNQSYTLGNNIEALTLISNTPINGNGNQLHNFLRGNPNGNILNGFDGNDTLSGSGGNDQLLGGVGNDSLVGGFGDDTLIGGVGNDTLIGGVDDDFYRFNSPNEGIDTIVGFSLANDTILINGVAFGGISTGTLSANLLAVGMQATNPNQRFVYNNSNGNLFYDSDGSGTNNALQIASFNEKISLTHQDIIVI